MPSTRHSLWTALVTLAVLLVFGGSAVAATLPANTSNFSTVFAEANAGDTILLGSGNYGTFRGALKTGEVVIREQEGATASIAVEFTPASNITLDGLDVNGAYITGLKTKNITIRNSVFDGHSVIMRGDDLSNANILLDNNKHINRNVCSGCYDGRITIATRGETPTGVTIQNSYFARGTMDGILNGGHSVQILNNEFHDIAQITSGDIAHTDAIQLYGSKNTVISGNYFHGVSAPIMAPDGADHELIENNVMAGDGGSAFRITLGADNGSIIRHNTLADGACGYGKRCGILGLGGKNAFKGSGTLIYDNILDEVSLQGSTPTMHHNLFTRILGEGAGNELGMPSYEGGAQPQTRDGFRLVAGSLGKGTASDGLDRGALFKPTATPTPPPDPEPVPEPEPAPDPEYAPLCKPLCDETIAARDATIAERDATITERNATIAARDKTIAERDATVTSQASKLDRIHAIVHRSDLTSRDKVLKINTIFHE